MAQLRPDRSRSRKYLILTVIVLLLAGGWIGFWKYAADAAQQTVQGWRAREAKAGRIFTCGTEEFGGFPFRFELLCDRATAILRSGQTPVELRVAQVHVAAQVYQPSLLISEYTGPLTVGDPDQPPTYAVNWTLAQSSVSGLPQSPQRVSIVVDTPVVSRIEPAGEVLRADHMEIHGRIAEGSAANRPVLDVALEATRLQMPEAGPLLAPSTDANIDSVLRGLNDFSPKPWRARFREIQEAGGRIDIRKMRVQQGDTIAVGGGTLSINPQGRLEGQLNMTVAGLDAFVNRISAETGQKLGFSVSLGLGLIGGNRQVEGRPAITVPLKIVNGAMMLGPLKIGEIPPLF